VADALNAAWDSLEERVAGEFAQSGVARDAITFTPLLRAQYFGQLNDLELASPVSRLRSRTDVEAVLEVFEELYAKIYRRSARTPEFGHMFTSAISLGSVQVDKPQLPDEQPEAEIPAGAQKAAREIWHQGGWVSARIFEMERLRAGNVIEGPAVIEDPATTFVLPPGTSAALDRHRIFHLRQEAPPASDQALAVADTAAAS
jgi:acetone carboxylase, beta subunit